MNTDQKPPRAAADSISCHAPEGAATRLADPRPGRARGRPSQAPSLVAAALTPWRDNPMRTDAALVLVLVVVAVAANGYASPA